jgi:Uma2 family endonuclease
MQAAIKPTISREEYLEMEKHSEIKHEFFQGEIFAMSGGTFNHARIGRNIVSALLTRLRGKPCEPMNSDMRVQTPSGLDTYPDVSVFCGQAELADKQHSLLNPVAIFEVLSPSTRSYDRGDKFAHYRTLDSLRDYVLVDAERLAVEHFRRADNGEWVLHEYREAADCLPLPAIAVELPLAEMYAGIEFGSGV